MRGKYALPVVKTEEEAKNLIRNRMGWFMVVPEMWTGVLETTPEVEYREVEPYDEVAEEAYEVVADTIDDLINFITSFVASKPDGPYFIEFRCLVRGFELDERAIDLMYSLRAEEEEDDI